MERNAGRSERYCEHCAAGKKIKIMEAEICPDHIHMLIEIPPKVAVSSFMGYLKGKSSRMIHERFPELRYQYRNREFWCRGYYVDTAGKNAKKISEYIKHQLEEDQAGERLTMGNFQARLRAAGNSPSRLAVIRGFAHL